MRLSVLIPSYNHAKYVAQAIRAAAAIRIREKQIIVVDDGSKDDSVRVIRRVAREYACDAEFTLVARPNRGLVATLNEGLALVRGENLVVCASDDTIVPEGVLRLLESLEQTPGCVACVGNAVAVAELRRRHLLVHGTELSHFFSAGFAERQRLMLLDCPAPILVQAAVFRTEALRIVGGWNEALRLDDWPLWFALAGSSTGELMRFYPDVVSCHYRLHDSNAHKRMENHFSQQLEAVRTLSPPELLTPSERYYFANFILTSLRAGRFALADTLLAQARARGVSAGLGSAIVRQALKRCEKMAGRRYASCGCGYCPT